MKPTNKRNPHLVELIENLLRQSREHEAKIWRDVAERLAKSRKNWAEVNIGRVARHASKGETILVPGKLLGSGEIDFPVTVASFKASASAVEKIEKAGGKVITIEQLMKERPDGSGVRIMG